MLGLMLLAAASRCADIAVCPTDSELISALIVYDEDIRQLTADVAAQEGEIVLFHRLQSPYALEEAVCGEREKTEPLKVTCELTARYTTHDVLRVARLVHEKGAWRIIEPSSVKRENS